MLLIGGQLLLTIVNLVAISSLNLNTLPASQHATVVQQVAAINATPLWAVPLAAWERLWTLPIHVAFSVLVLQVFRRGNIAWLWLAVLCHAVVDFISVGLLQLLGRETGPILLVEGLIAVFGIIGIWVIWRLRDQLGQSAVTPEEPSVPHVPDTALS
jgi:uncharacterized membrane protein YhfC